MLMAVTAISILVFWIGCGRSGQTRYYSNQGRIFGTYYNIRYAYTRDMKEEIEARLQQFDGSLSTFNPHSVISVLNQGRDTVWDEDFRTMYAMAEEINRLSHGAFDIRVAPLVNAWGFGFKHKETITPELIDSLRQVRNVLDASAIAKGQSCDVIGRLLADKGIEDYLVDIGGEVVVRGRNQQGNKWRIGINKPIDDNSQMTSEIETVVETDDVCMATSGNYRNYYYEGEEKRSHTIDPRTGYPVKHNLLSATVTASSCMRADALATACMVLGAEDAMEMIEGIEDAECFLIIGSQDSTQTRQSSGWKY